MGSRISPPPCTFAPEHLRAQQRKEDLSCCFACGSQSLCFIKSLEIPDEIEVWAFISLAVRLSHCASWATRQCRGVLVSAHLCLCWNYIFICRVFRSVFTAWSLHPQITNVILVTEVPAGTGGWFVIIMVLINHVKKYSSYKRGNRNLFWIVILSMHRLFWYTFC